jgi:hypothetical protein
MARTSFYVSNNEFFSVQNFVDLDDAPSDYEGHGGKAVAVKETEDGVEFIDFPEGGGGAELVADSVTNTFLADMAAGTVKARGTGSTGDPQDITVGVNLTLDATSLRSDKTTANIQTASYTLVIGDAGKTVEQNVATANDLTVPPNSSVAFPTGAIINLYQMGVGQTTIVAGVGVTIRARNGLKLAGQYAEAGLRKRDTDEWVLVGDTTT